MILLFAVLVWAAGYKLVRWAQSKPYQPRLVSGLALLVGGTFFIYYWGLSLTFDIGFWGYRLGGYAAGTAVKSASPDAHTSPSWGRRRSSSSTVRSER